MELYVIKTGYFEVIRKIILEVEEKEKTYKIIKVKDGHYSKKIISKGNVNRFNELENEVICTDLKEGLRIFAEGINTSLEEEQDRHFAEKTKLLEIKDNIIKMQMIENE